MRFSYTAEQPDELSLETGQMVNILDMKLEDDGWWKGELNGKIGVFPDNFVELVVEVCLPLQVLFPEIAQFVLGVITPNQIPLTTIVTYLQKGYRSRISNHWATIPACSVVPPIYKKSKKTYCHVSF